MTPTALFNQLIQSFRGIAPASLHDVPEHIRSDNGPEFIAQAIKTWLTNLNVQTLYIPPGEPWENGSPESFHSRQRDEFLNAEEFDNLAHARVLSTTWKLDYNHRPPHATLPNHRTTNSNPPNSHNTWHRKRGQPEWMRA